MSFLGYIGHIMSGSGLEDLWEQVYTKNSIICMLSGHAFSRAVRAHIFTLLGLLSVLLKNSDCECYANREYLCN